MLLALLCAGGAVLCLIAFFVMMLLLRRCESRDDMGVIYFICMIVFGIASVVCAAGTYQNAEQYQKQQHEIELQRVKQ
jgi:NADH:ubiquinone oxidoreductase subunit 6 (subunit J)